MSFSLRFQKVTSLPPVYQPSTVYLVASSNTELVDIYVPDATGQHVIQGINNLATYGLLSQERASDILNNPILPEEVYKP